MAIFASRNKNGNLACNFVHVNGIPGFPQSPQQGLIGVCVEQNDAEQRLEFFQRMTKKPPVRLAYEKIVCLKTMKTKDFVEKDKSAIGRAAVGGLLFGSAGAVIGGISGTGKKKVYDPKKYFVIYYRSGEDITPITLEVVEASLHFKSFVQNLESKLNLMQMPDSEELPIDL